MGSFNQQFCSALEYHLSKMLSHSPDEELRRLWCDGVSHEALNKSKKFVNDTGKIITKAWIGKNGQQEYELTMHFGNKAQSRFSRNLSLEECLPPEDAAGWIKIDVENKTVELQLL
jgi:hypothetical protein